MKTMNWTLLISSYEILLARRRSEFFWQSICSGVVGSTGSGGLADPRAGTTVGPLKRLSARAGR